LLVCLGAPAAAQVGTIQGIVLDDRTGQPVTQVRISVENQSSPVQYRDDGGFLLTVPPGTHTLVVSAIGYAVAKVTVEVVPDQATPLTIRLSEGTGAYSEHVDVVGGADGTTANAPGAVTLFGRDLANLRGAILDDPLRAVQSLPAVSATDDFYSEFAVRGSSFRHVGLTVDGISSKYLMHTINDIVDGGSVTMVNSEALGAVELLPGSYPQKAGRHIGAEVNLGTRDGSRERFRGRAGLSGTSATFLGEGPIAHGRGSWLASVRRSYLDYLIKRIDPSAGVAFGFTDGQARLVFDVTSHHQVDWTMLLGRAAFDGGDDSDGVNDTASATSRGWLSSLGWRYTNERMMLWNRLYLTGLDFTNRNPLEAVLDSARFSNVGWRLDGSVLARRNVLLEFGGDAQSMNGQHTRRAAPPGGTTLVTAGAYDEHAAAASAYAQASFHLSAFTITPGVRGDYWSMTRASTASPWLNVRAGLGARTAITIGTGLYRQFAEFDQVFGLNGGGTQLSPERAVHADAGIELKLAASTTLTVSAFFRRESDVLWPPDAETRLVNNRIVPATFAAKWINALDGDARGGEIVVRRDSPRGLSGWAGYAYSRLQYNRPAGNESFSANADQRHTLSLYGNYRITSRTGASARYRYGSNFPIIGYLTTAPSAPVDPDTGGPAYYQLTSVRNTVRLRPYSRLDLRADHAFLWGSRRLVVFVEVANLQNRTNLRNTPYSVDRNGRVFGVTQSMMPIVPSAGFTIEF
jgi:hypothetical protein